MTVDLAAAEPLIALSSTAASRAAIDSGLPVSDPAFLLSGEWWDAGAGDLLKRAFAVVIWFLIFPVVWKIGTLWEDYSDAFGRSATREIESEPVSDSDPEE
ncbi:hypothetical protein [Halegenticoccus soli]|uniref:hypothetical protein n=1 Tax=Halegenticoccus soli TaxID=1985678 RepID=UPI00117B6800|nr:hypothetical protein [Halegenticoccus soli]